MSILLSFSRETFKRKLLVKANWHYMQYEKYLSLQARYNQNPVNFSSDVCPINPFFYRNEVPNSHLMPFESDVRKHKKLWLRLTNMAENLAPGEVLITQKELEKYGL